MTISASLTAWGTEEAMAEEVAEEVNIVVPNAELVCLTRIRLGADIERASTIIATLMTNNAE